MNSVITLIISNSFTRNVIFPTSAPSRDTHCPAVLDLFSVMNLSICSAMTFPSRENSDVVTRLPLTFPLLRGGELLFIAHLLIILVLFGMVFMIISEIFYRTIPLIWVVLLLPLNVFY